jgi:hypothetical protein
MAVKLMKDPAFQRMVKQAQGEWNAADNAKNRIQLKAQIALEETILTLFSIANDQDAPAAARVTAIKEMKSLAGIKEDDTPTGPSTGLPQVLIYLNSDQDEPIDITAKEVSKNITQSDGVLLDRRPAK